MPASCLQVFGKSSTRNMIDHCIFNCVVVVILTCVMTSTKCNCSNNYRDAHVQIGRGLHHISL